MFIHCGFKYNNKPWRKFRKKKQMKNLRKMFGKILKYFKKFVFLKNLQIQKKRLGIFEILNGN